MQTLPKAQFSRLKSPRRPSKHFPDMLRKELIVSPSQIHSLDIQICDYIIYETTKFFTNHTFKKFENVNHFNTSTNSIN